MIVLLGGRRMSFDDEHRSVVYGLMTGILGRTQWHRCAARQMRMLFLTHRTKLRQYRPVNGADRVLARIGRGWLLARSHFRGETAVTNRRREDRTSAVVGVP